VRLEAPAETAVAALCVEGWSVTRVEPNVALEGGASKHHAGGVLQASSSPRDQGTRTTVC